MKTHLIFIYISLQLFYACNNAEDKFNSKISSNILNKDSVFTFKGIYPDCDSILILVPYTNLEQIKKMFNISLSKIWFTNIESQDTHTLILFVKNKSIKDYFSVRRRDFVFRDVNSYEIYNLKDTFIVKGASSSKHGYVYIYNLQFWRNKHNKK